MPLILGTESTTEDEFASDLPTRTYLGDSGIVLDNGNTADALGRRWRRVAGNAWGSKPAPREQVGDRPYDHGQWDATRYYGPRVIPMSGQCLVNSHADLHDAEQALRDTIGLSALRLRITEPGYDSWAMVRQMGEVQWSEINQTAAAYSFTVYARDPQLYSSLERPFGPVAFPSVSGGATWPLTWPATWATTVASGSVALSNPGRLPAPLWLRVDGPLEVGTIALPDLGLSLNLENPEGDVLASGQWLEVDAALGHVWLNGDALRDGWVYGDWPVLPPNSETTLSIAGTGFTTSSVVTGTYRTARI